MEDFFQKMNEEYASKHFPEGTVLGSALKKGRRGGIMGLLFFVLFFAGFLYASIWVLRRTISFQAEGKTDMIGIGVGVCIVLALLALGCFFVIRMLVKAIRQDVNDLIASSAKASKLSVSEVEEFDRQALASDCYILKLTAGLDRALSNSTFKDGLLTRDYIYLGDAAQTVMRIDRLKACFFSDLTYYVNVGNRSRKIHNLVIFLLAEGGITVHSDTTEEAGQALMDMLTDRNSAIDTNEGRVVPEGRAFDDYTKRILEAS